MSQTMSQPSRRGRGAALVLLAAVLLAACEGAVLPASSVSVPSAVAPAATPAPGESPTPEASPPAEDPSPSAGVPVEGSLGGYWRVQESPDRSAPVALTGAVDRQAFVVYRVEPSCAEEPCERIRLSVLPPTYSGTLRELDLTRTGDAYASRAAEGVAGPCLTDDGTSVPGGARTSEVTRLWLEEVRQTGTAVTSLELRGEIVVTGELTDAGRSAGCEPWTLRYAIIGSETGAPADPGDGPTPTSGATTADTVPRPDLRFTITGATVAYFSIRGRTVDAIAASVGAGGVKACGRIGYEWYEGDTRPSGCMSTEWRTFEVRERTRADGSCRLDVQRISARYVVRLPRWTSPARVPAPLARWWTATVTFIRDHEAGHVLIARRWVAKLRALVDGKACSRLEKIVSSWASDMQTAQEAYDQREYRRPWPPVPDGY